MLKSAVTKIAHNTTMPALAGHSDLRPLQDLIAAEKTVLTSLQKLRADLVKAGDALRIWGQGEGDDLGDILTVSATILTHFATAFSTYSSLHHTIRDSMKSVRTREEVLDELRRRPHSHSVTLVSVSVTARHGSRAPSKDGEIGGTGGL